MVYLRQAIMTSGQTLTGLSAAIEMGVKILKAGGLVSFPTDTVYGLGADAFNREGVEEVYEVKKRPHELPLPLLIAEHSQLKGLAARIPEFAWVLMNVFWPGGVTLVLPRGECVPSFLNPGAKGLAVRIPDNQIALELIRGLESPIVGTSANISGRPSPVIAQEVREQLQGVFVIDGGRCAGGLESTVVDATGEHPKILRVGLIPVEAVKAVVGTLLQLEEA